jgi:speckle-type POZ protein
VATMGEGKHSECHYAYEDEAEMIKIRIGWGTRQLLNIEDIFNENNNFLSNDTLTLLITVREDTLFLNARLRNLFQLTLYQYQPRDTSDRLIAKYFDSSVFSDITIVCSDKKEIAAHRNILARSPVFEKMLTAETTNKIVLDDINGDTMKELLRFIYTLKVENLDTLAPKLLHAAEKYGLPQLKLKCATELIERVSLENVFENLVLANSYNEQSLLDECMEFINT